ncbi:unnamed protein product [Ceutorhynchus assimilis]|uniref:Fucosyltransferase n=1 Tax=Ceutorhynchus assimilis TaxID=467358 RepID=A0A9N9N2F6_9CUCU|nr:unnamed protein product [Ceutorhynchus assimilis]
MGFAAIQKNKTYIVLSTILLTLTYFIFSAPRAVKQSTLLIGNLEIRPPPLDPAKIGEWWMLRNPSNGTQKLSKLGEVLFLSQPELPQDTDKQYKILVWKYGPTIERRHLKHFSESRIDPFSYCPVKNCEITYEDQDIKTADIVIIHLHRIKGVHDLPNNTYPRDPNQIWTFLTDESPFNTFMSSNDPLYKYNGLFNWSMTYRMDSDIPVPYGRTVLKKPPEEDAGLVELLLNKKRDVLVAVLGSNCGGQNHRWQFIYALQKYIQVDIYGGCGTELKHECPGHFGQDCPEIGDYLFYLSFENSNCDEYITEKLWWNAFHKNSIPIVMGSSKETYKKLLPIDSYINVDDFANPQALAQYVQRLNDTGEFKTYYSWKNNFEIFNEHGYFKSTSFHYCRICQAMNYNDREMKVYNDLENYWSVKRDCHHAWDDWKEDNR